MKKPFLFPLLLISNAVLAQEHLNQTSQTSDDIERMQAPIYGHF